MRINAFKYVKITFDLAKSYSGQKTQSSRIKESLKKQI